VDGGQLIVLSEPPGMSGDSISWKRCRWWPPPWSVKSCADLTSGRGSETPIGACVSRSTPIFPWCCELVWKRGGGGRTVSRPRRGNRGLLLRARV